MQKTAYEVRMSDWSSDVCSSDLLDGHDRIEGDLRGGVIALGNFDGFHAGHQAVVGRAVHHAKDEGLPAIVATFDPHPVRFFKPDVPPFRLTTLDQRDRKSTRLNSSH